MGLLTEVVPDGAHLDRALELAEGLARFPQRDDARRSPRRDRGARHAPAGRPGAGGGRRAGGVRRRRARRARFAAGEGRGGAGAGA